ncbi:lyase family protein [Streptomyces sp. NPDC087658]|uniref:lyase family protein n=1 Tax=Streptomyces sp. NPDC087658 TaxID=3365800 RepID=UPI00381DE699
MTVSHDVNRQQPVDTGRLRTGLNPEAHAIVYGQYLNPASTADALLEELRLISTVDRAHLVMLADRSIVDQDTVRALLTEIDALRASNFATLQSRPLPRGVYLAYEHYLSETLGEKAGVLHTGRSRNDLNATTVRLRARAPYTRLLTAVDMLADSPLARAEQYADVTIPSYTHGQPAVPITYGHYLAGVANGVLRALDDLVHAGSELDTNPLGAGAVGGTSVPIDTSRTTELLGFATPTRNSVDAVASRDFVLRLLGAASVLGTVLVRVARDLGAWCGDDAGLLLAADDLVGSSSMMPQKRNPFLLEHVQGKAAAALGSWTAAAHAMSTAGYTNAIAVGTEATAHLWPGLLRSTEAVTLLRLMVAGTVPVADRAVERCVSGHTTATYLAERLVLDGVPFRTAHHRVGRAVLNAVETGTPLTLGDNGPRCPHPGEVAAACRYGGGPGAVRAAVGSLRAELRHTGAEWGAREARWDGSEALLDGAVRALVPEGPSLI